MKRRIMKRRKDGVRQHYIVGRKSFSSSFEYPYWEKISQSKDHKDGLKVLDELETRRKQEKKQIAFKRLDAVDKIFESKNISDEEKQKALSDLNTTFVKDIRKKEGKITGWI